MADEAEDRIVYQVVLNHEEQYSIWPADRDIPDGWRAEGMSGRKPECLAYIDEVWTDMRPLSLRQYMAEQEAVAEGAEDGPGDLAEPEEAEESLVSRLSRGDHAVEVSLRPEPTGAALRAAVDRGYVFVRFTQTRGGTELGIRLDLGASDLTRADFDAPAGEVRLVGDLTLDFEPARCIAEIDLATMTGRGRLAAAGAAP
jgi:uncharacterized protein YbdZ (MbtH family)